MWTYIRSTKIAVMIKSTSTLLICAKLITSQQDMTRTANINALPLTQIATNRLLTPTTNCFASATYSIWQSLFNILLQANNVYSQETYRTTAIKSGCVIVGK